MKGREYNQMYNKFIIKVNKNIIFMFKIKAMNIKYK